jgi:hypothetical protein
VSHAIVEDQQGNGYDQNHATTDPNTDGNAQGD